jgi:uncharacterized protein (DUF58 family)
MAATLLSPEFMRELEALRRRLSVRTSSGAAGERVARRRGSSAEFLEHRGYTPGDDLRRLDWSAFGRTGQPVYKLFRAEEDVVVRLLLDGSASLGFGDPTKLEVARRLAAALGYVALRGAQRVQLFVAQSAESRPLGHLGPVRRGRAGFASLLREIEEVTAAGQCDLGRAVDRLVRLSERPGLLVVLSDFFDPGPVTTALGRARSAGHDVGLVQILDQHEIEPDWEGDLCLVDCESGARVELTVDPASIEAYCLRLGVLVEALRRWARQRGARYVRLATDEPLGAVVKRFLNQAID